MPKTFEKSPGFDRRVWLLLLAMLAFRFGQGLYFPFSTIHFHNAGALLEARLPDLIWLIQLAAATLATVALVALRHQAK